MMPKNDTIAAIRKFNPTADPVFLAGFGNNDLDEYLHRLRHLPTQVPISPQTLARRAPLVAAIAPQIA